MNIESSTIPKVIPATEAPQQAPATNQDSSTDAPTFKAALAYVKGQDATPSLAPTSSAPTSSAPPSSAPPSSAPASSAAPSVELTAKSSDINTPIDKTQPNDKKALLDDKNILKGQINLQKLAFEGQNEIGTNVELVSQINQSSIEKTKQISINSDKKTVTKTGKESKVLVELKNPEINLALQPLLELNSKLSAIKDLKISSVSKTERKENKLPEAVINYQTIKMNNNDALFFANLIKNENFSAQQAQNGSNISTELKAESIMQSAQVSQVLMDAIGDSIKTNKPFRIDFDKDISVILKVDKNGKLSAEFIPGDKAVENYLRNNIPLLEQRLDEQNIPYSNLSYQRQKQHNQHQENNNKQNKEKDDE